MKRSLYIFILLGSVLGALYFLKERQTVIENFEKLKAEATITEDASQVDPADVILTHCEDGDLLCSSREINILPKLKEEMTLFLKNEGNPSQIQLQTSRDLKIKKQELQNLLKDVTSPIQKNVQDYEEAYLNRLLEVASSLDCFDFISKLLVFSSSSIKELSINLEHIKKLMSSQKNDVQALIKVQCNYLLNDDFSKIINLLSPLQSLQRLDLSGTFDDISIKTICSLFQFFPLMREVSIQGDYSDDRIELLCSAIQDLRKLETVFFQAKFSDEGALRLCQILEKNVMIKDFGLSGNISNKKIQPILSILADNQVLEIFRLKGTFNTQGARELAQFLFNKNNLKEAYIDGQFQDLNMFSQIYGKVKKVIVNGIQLRY